jgi:molybdate transport system permease protein
VDPLWVLVARSLFVAALGVCLALPCALWLGLRLARGQLRAGAAIETVAMLPLVLPPVVTGFALLSAFSPLYPPGQWLQSAFGIRVPFTLAAAVLAAAVVSFPLLLRGIKSGFAGVGVAYEEVAATLGCSRTQVFLRVTLPLAKPGLVAGMMLALARALGEFGATLVVAGNIPGRTQTLPLAIYRATQVGDTRTGWTLILIAVFLALALTLLARPFER